MHKLVWLILFLIPVMGCGDGHGNATNSEERAVLSETERATKPTEKNNPQKGTQGNEEIAVEPGETVSDGPRYLFREEAEALAKAAGCSRMKNTAASGGFGPLAGCIEGGAETAKLFVNGASGSTAVENVKVMWNDWFRDTGYGLHPDRADAERLLVAVVNRFVPAQLDEVREAFFGRRDLRMDHESFRITVTHDKGPAIEEHLLTVTFPRH